MHWSEFKKILNFTPMEEIFEQFGNPKFKIGRLLYYMGNGYCLGFSERKFRVENHQRVEYGELGEYYVRLYFFKKRDELERYFRINGKYEFEADTFGDDFEITDGIRIGSTHEEVSRIIKSKKSDKYYAEVENRAMNEKREFVYQCDQIMWGEYVFRFFGKSKQTPLTAFEYNPK